MLDLNESAGTKESRRFIRHPMTIPIRCSREGHHAASEHDLRNMSFGGLSFVSNEAYSPGDMIDIEFPTLRHHAKLRGEVVWCSPASDKKPHQYLNGMKFLDESDLYHARLIEQICHIESYRRAQELHYGRKLTSQVAAEEWIAKHANQFPR